jgi:site-specific DNA-methyltransferase (adenine-specific)
MNHQIDLFLQETSLPEMESDKINHDLGQYFTPKWASEVLVKDELGENDNQFVLEPSCGDGSILSCLPSGCRAIGVEIDPGMARKARKTGHRIICEDIRNVDLEDNIFDAVIGNPPFSAKIIDPMMDKITAHLRDEGVVGLVLPAYIPASTNRIEKWNQHYHIETRLLPRMIYPSLSLPLAWTRMIKTKKRTLVGFFLFTEQMDISSMPGRARKILQTNGTWKEVIADALKSLGGEAPLQHIYQAVEPRRKSDNPFWREKTRQILARHSEIFERVNNSWKLAA